MGRIIQSRPWRHMPGFLSILAGMVLLGGCVTAGSPYRPVDAKAVPGDLHLAAVALGSRLQGTDPAAIERDFRVSGTDLVAPTDAGDLGGTVLRGVSLTGYEAPAGTGGGYSARGYLTFVGAVDQAASAAFDIDYTLTGPRSMAFTRVAWNPVAPQEPRVHVAVVAADRVRELGKAGSFAEFYGKVVSAAVPLTQPSRVPAGRRPYTVFAFVMDRLGLASRLSVSVSSDLDGGKPLPGVTRVAYRRVEGWLVARVDGDLALSATDPVYLQVNYAPDGAATRNLGPFALRPGG